MTKYILKSKVPKLHNNFNDYLLLLQYCKISKPSEPRIFNSIYECIYDKIDNYIDTIFDDEFDKLFNPQNLSKIDEFFKIVLNGSKFKHILISTSYKTSVNKPNYDYTIGSYYSDNYKDRIVDSIELYIYDDISKNYIINSYISYKIRDSIQPIVYYNYDTFSKNDII